MSGRMAFSLCSFKGLLECGPSRARKCAVWHRVIISNDGDKLIRIDVTLVVRELLAVVLLKQCFGQIQGVD